MKLKRASAAAEAAIGIAIGNERERNEGSEGRKKNHLGWVYF